MKFQPDSLEGVNVVTRHESSCLWVGTTPYAYSILVPWTGPVLRWPASSPQDLSALHFERIVELQPEVVIYGSGVRLQFPPPALLRVLYERRIGIETMDTAAACRTYNVLASEGRRVLGALLVGNTAQGSASPETL
jgi:uncharacterized protein